MSPTIQETVLHVKGMDCTSCAASIESAVANLPDVEQCHVNFTTETMRVVGSANPAAIARLVDQLGYAVADPEEAEATSPAGNFFAFIWQRRETRLAALAALLLLPGLVLTELLGQELGWTNALALAALALAGWPVAHDAWRSLRYARRININVLMTIAAVGAVVIGAYVEAAMVMVLFALGEALEGFTADRARNAIRGLMTVAPRTATRLTANGAQEVVDVDTLAVGDVIVVRPGERIAMDGRVREGQTTVDQSAITGESRLMDKGPGDTLFAGSINGAGALELEVTRLAADNTISRMIQMVEAAQERQAPAQRFIDRFAEVYTPVVALLALLTAMVPPLLFGQPFWNPDAETTGWLYRGLALLVVACPCALVISTPVTIISAISNAARQGVLIKGGVYLEKLSQVRTIALDKTGTLTEGRPVVTTIRSAACQANGAACGWPDCAPCADVLGLAGAVESRSEHPLANAVTNAFEAHGLSARYSKASDVSALTGRGVTGWVNGRRVQVGSHRWFDEQVPHSDAMCALAAAEAAQGQTPLLVGADGDYLGTITVADAIRPSSKGIIDQLKALGIHTIVMLTGDEQSTAQRIAADLGITDVRSELLPEEKVGAVRALQAESGTIAMVGDGINDAPALASADIGIAIGGAGSTTQAMETADMTLMDQSLERLPFLIRLSRAAMRTIRTNIVLSIGIKLLFLLLVLVGVGTMWMAVLADVGTSVLVTLYGMRLLRFA